MTTRAKRTVRTASLRVDWPQRLATKFADRVASVSDERGMRDGVWFYLRPGWCDDMPCHSIHEHTARDAERSLRLNTFNNRDCETCAASLTREAP